MYMYQYCKKEIIITSIFMEMFGSLCNAHSEVAKIRNENSDFKYNCKNLRCLISLCLLSFPSIFWSIGHTNFVPVYRHYEIVCNDFKENHLKITINIQHG